MKRLTVILILLCLFAGIPAMAAETPTEIHTAEDLLAIAEDPAGSYILMEDLDLAGIMWPCPDFSGTFDGNGHALLNLELTQPGATTALSYDGNQKSYDTYFAGFFGTLRNAQVKDLQLINVRGLIHADAPCFLGGLAGYSQDSTITGCTVTGCLELRAFDRMFGIAGLVGYGNGIVDSCNVDVTLICTDTDPNTRDEQFMGGILATGYMDIYGSQIQIDGYCSEYGYVHNGGIVGMYSRKPIGYDYKGELLDNTVTGKITFFECNSDRRAYCKAEAGEKLGGYRKFSNTTDFIRDERKDYSTELRPEMCPEPVYAETLVDPGCNTYGYTQYTCTGCGYSYRDAYTLFSHTLTQWQILEPPTTEKEGLSKASCDLCGLEATRTEPMLEVLPTEPAPATEPAAESTAAPGPSQEELPSDKPPYPVLAALACCTVGLLVCILRPLFKKPYRGKYTKKS